MLATLLLTAVVIPQEIEPGPGDTMPPFQVTPPFKLAAKDNRRVLFLVPPLSEGQEILQKGILEPRSIKRLLQYEYVLEEITSRPFPPEASRRPAFLIYSADGEELGSFTFAETVDLPQQPAEENFLAFLKEHQTEPWDAMEVLESARKRAAAEKKRLLVNLGAPW